MRNDRSAWRYSHMKFYTKYLLLLLLLAVVVPMLIKGPNGRPLMSVDDWLPDRDTIRNNWTRLTALFQSSPGDGSLGREKAPQATEPSSGLVINSTEHPEYMPSAPSGKLYRWRDDSGHWHFSTSPPPLGQTVSVEELPDVKNVMEAPVAEDGDGSNMFGLHGMSVDSAGKLLEQIQQQR